MLEGTKVTSQTPVNGYTSEAYKILKDPKTKEQISRTLISKDTYKPTDKIVKVGTKKVETTPVEPEEPVVPEVTETPATPEETTPTPTTPVEVEQPTTTTPPAEEKKPENTGWPTGWDTPENPDYKG